MRSRDLVELLAPMKFWRTFHAATKFVKLCRDYLPSPAQSVAKPLEFIGGRVGFLGAAPGH